MHKERYDVIVIGTGPGGEGAAMKCAKEGKEVAVIDDFDLPGGNCTHRGTIPSKALRHAVQQMTQANQIRQLDYQHLLRVAEPVVKRQTKLRSGFYTRNQVDMIHGRASFIDPHCVEVKTIVRPRAALPCRPLRDRHRRPTLSSARH